MLMGQAQQSAAAVPGLIQPRNVYALFRRMQTQLGFENEDFATDPSSPEFAQATSGAPPPDPYLEGEKIKAQVKTQENQTDAQLELRKQNQDMALEITKLEVGSGIDLAKAGIGAEVAIQRGAQQASARSATAAGKPAASGSNGSAGGRPRGANEGSAPR